MTRHRLLAGVCSLTILAGCTEAPRLSHLVVPEATATQEAPVDVAHYMEKYPGFDGVMINIEETIEHSGIREDMSSGLGILGGLVNNWTFSRIFKERYIVLNPEAQWLTTYSFNYKPDTMYMMTIAPSGQITRFTTDDLQKYRDDDGRDRYKIAFPRVEKGTIVEVGSEDSYKPSYFLPPLEHQIPLQFHVPCEHIKFTYVYPNWWMIANKMIGDGRGTPVTTSDTAELKKTLITYENRDIPPLRSEPFAPPFMQVAMYYQFMVTDLSMKGITWSAPKNWGELAKRFRKYAIKKADSNVDELRPLVDSLTSGIKNANDKVDRIVSWVSRNIERSGESNSADPAKTLEKKKGTRYDITSLAQAMLYVAGIGSNFILVHNSEDGYFDPYYISDEQIYAPALQIATDNQGPIVFPWIKNLPVGLTPEQYQGQPAIVVSEGEGGSTLDLPVQTSGYNLIQDSLTLTLDSTGDTHVIELRTLEGMPAYRARRELEGLELQARKDSVKAMVSLKNVDLNSFSYTVKNDTLWNAPLILCFAYDLPNLVAIAPEEAIFQSAGLFSPIPEGDKVDTLARQNPIWIESPTEYRKQIVLKYPEQWNPTTRIDSVSFENDFGIVMSQSEIGNGTIAINQKASLKRTHQPKAKIGQLAALVGTGSKASVPVIVFKTGAPPPAGKP